VLTLLLGRLRRLGYPAVRRALCFGAVGASGLAVNTGTVLALAALGFDGLSWPLWVASELSVLWNYQLHRRLTWRDRPGGTWWAYNLNAGLTGLVGIAVTRGLGQQVHAPLWLASPGGIAAGGVLSYLLAAAVVFGRLARRRARHGPARARGVTAAAGRRLGYLGRFRGASVTSVGHRSASRGSTEPRAAGRRGATSREPSFTRSPWRSRMPARGLRSGVASSFMERP
jgi:putative flippase GtrA